MEEKNIIYDFKKEEKRRKRKEWFHNTAHNTMNWVYSNKELIMIIGPSLIGATTFGIKTISKQSAMRKEKNLKDLYCYDRSLGHYWRLKRELTNSEWVTIDKRKMNGERLADILDELKVLK